MDLPPIVFGTTSLGNLFVKPSDLEKRELIQAWFDIVSAPIAIDCAGKYGAGLALEVLGRELAELKIASDQVLISNKLGWRRTSLQGSEPTFEPGVWIGLEHDAVQDISYHGIRRCWAEGCELLGGYVPQMLSVHDPDEYLAAASGASDRKRRLDDVVGAYHSLYELRDSGSAQSIGIGCKDWKIIRELDLLCKFDWVMFANSFTIMSHPIELVEFMNLLVDRGVVIINSAVLHGGFLSGGSFCDYKPMNPDNASDAEKLAWRKAYLEVCNSHGLSPFDVAVAYGRSHRGIKAVALSTSRADRAASLVRAATQSLPDTIWSELIKAGLIENQPLG